MNYINEKSYKSYYGYLRKHKYHNTFLEHSLKSVKTQKVLDNLFKIFELTFNEEIAYGEELMNFISNQCAEVCKSNPELVEKVLVDISSLKKRFSHKKQAIVYLNKTLKNLEGVNSSSTDFESSITILKEMGIW